MVAHLLSLIGSCWFASLTLNDIHFVLDYTAAAAVKYPVLEIYVAGPPLNLNHSYLYSKRTNTAEALDE